MSIEFKGKPISNMKDWQHLVFSGKKAIHWKKDRSAYSIADFILNNKGIDQIKKMIATVVPGVLTIHSVEPEYEARFDSYGHGREHDLAIRGEMVSDDSESNKTVFIGVEAKVDESFGGTIGEAYLEAKAKDLRGKKTNAPERIENLMKNTFQEIAKSDFDLRYQLLHATAGTLCVTADVHIMLILVFKTDLYNPELGASNKKDLQNFLKKIKAVETSKDSYTATIGGKVLHIIYKEL